VDADLRPEGKDGPLARSLDAFRSYYESYAEPWERLAMVRARGVAGDRGLSERFFAALGPFVWRDGLTDEERREIRRSKARVERERISTSEDAQYHLKLGPGTLSDIEFTAQLLQLEHGIRAPGTREALDTLLAAGVLDADDHRVLTEAHRFCERTRNRWFLVNSAPGDTLPPGLEDLERLAASLGTSARPLRDDYRRVTRRSRRVFERLFYGRDQ
ncbi:MAG TPA: putative nucleotidyltransferase substrate binding domain-containing protein, partial [Acidimicrobiales bacterium]|nr:putative nucleotidyltransferase substrate binding domain-containing protein [Acidimicrobiales bacterium]